MNFKSKNMVNDENFLTKHTENIKELYIIKKLKSNANNYANIEQ